MYTKSDYLNNAKEKKGKSPAWLVTFTDLSLLMLTFFIILLTFANINVQKFKDLIASLQVSFGDKVENADTYAGEIGTSDKLLANSYNSSSGFKKKTNVKTSIIDKYLKGNVMEYEIEKMMVNIMTFVNDNDFDDAVSVVKGKKSIRMKISDYLLFDAGKVDLKKGVFPLLDMISNILLNNNYYLIVEGHTDNTPIRSNIFPSNWELSSSRASVVIRYLIRKGISQERLTGIGYSSNYPLFPNDDPMLRKKNRRVELVITNVSPRSLVE